jgi:cytochrome c peroxidase
MPTGITVPQIVENLAAAQAMIPVTNRVEMRGLPGDHDVLGNVNELAQIPDSQYTAIWNATIARVVAIDEYKRRFNAVFPGVPASALSFAHAANAIAAFEIQSFSKTNSPFDRYLARDDAALSTDAKEGALLFFGRAGCSSCHNGPLLGGQSFANAGVPQLGPGTGKAAPLDAGREDFAPAGKPQFLFRVPPLRNVELTAPYMHDGAYATLEAVVSHYNNVDSALKAFTSNELDPAYRASYRGDAATVNAVLSTVDGRLRQPLGLSSDDQRRIVAFLRSLTDPSARDLSAIAPSAVPSGLPVRDP